MIFKDLVIADGFEFGTQRVITPEGFLEAPANIARSGVQLYRARELGLDKHGIEPDRIIRLHRPDEELFRPETLSAFDGKPVIAGDHKPIDATNWRDHAVGDMHGPSRNGPLLNVAKMVVRDKSAIDDVLSGKKYLSIGYKFDADLTSGVTAAGDSYDGVQRNIRPNHVLITQNPRGGPVCSIADSADAVTQGDRKMKKIVIDNIPVEVGDNEAGIIESLVKQRDDARAVKPSVTLKIGDASRTIVGGDAIVKEINDRDAEIDTLKKQILTPKQIDELVSARAVVVGDALKLVDKYDSNGKSNVQIQREVIEKVVTGDNNAKNLVTTMLAGKVIGDASEEIVSMVFRSLVATKGATVKTTDTTGADTALAAALTGKRDTATSTETKLSGREAFIENSRKAWQK